MAGVPQQDYLNNSIRYNVAEMNTRIGIGDLLQRKDLHTGRGARSTKSWLKDVCQIQASSSFASSKSSAHDAFVVEHKNTAQEGSAASTFDCTGSSETHSSLQGDADKSARRSLICREPREENRRKLLLSQQKRGQRNLLASSSAEHFVESNPSLIVRRPSRRRRNPLRLGPCKGDDHNDTHLRDRQRTRRLEGMAPKIQSSLAKGSSDRSLHLEELLQDDTPTNNNALQDSNNSSLTLEECRQNLLVPGDSRRSLLSMGKPFSSRRLNHCCATTVGSTTGASIITESARTSHRPNEYIVSMSASEPRLFAEQSPGPPARTSRHHTGGTSWSRRRFLTATNSQAKERNKLHADVNGANVDGLDNGIPKFISFERVMYFNS